MKKPVTQRTVINSEETTLYDVFVRDWWRDAEKGDGPWPNNLVPYAGAPKSYLKGGRGLTMEEAREMCQEWNAKHDPGRYSRKAEFEEA